MNETLRPLLERDECVLWQGGRSMGYGILDIPGMPPIRAHRFVFLALVGPIPFGTGWHVHHRCLNKLCINPAHLELVDVAAHRRLHRLVRCARGHVFDEANVYIRKDNGKRNCKACALLRQRERYHRLHPEAPYYPNRGRRRAASR